MFPQRDYSEMRLGTGPTDDCIAITSAIPAEPPIGFRTQPRGHRDHSGRRR
jgi:hypothetical protein